ncbi:Proteolipid protein 2 [Entomophthora muscae]|uniref:Proteolipid protein 2 n=1 Tax=Entomophthora muscae TaxID=34485 RepID=A0ACC2ULW1_9FUNG|nr:Proteolipid protein 2 [Entomophthora muscae]
MNPQDEDTEWNDILQLIEKALDEAVESFNLNKESKYDNCDLDELDELEDDLDERVILEYRNKRLAEFQAQLKKEKFGSVYQISKPDFIREVTEASKEAPVVVHLFKDSILACRQLNVFFDTLATSYKATKFVKIIGDLCIENYPDRNLPTLLLYNKGELISQLVGLQSTVSNGLTMKLPELEKLLHSHSMIDKHNPRSRKDEDSSEETKKTIRSKYSSDVDSD